MSSGSFSVKRKAVPPLVSSNYLPSPQSVLHHTMNSSSSQNDPAISPTPRAPSPKKKNPLSSLKKMLSLTRLNTNFSCPKDSNVPNPHQPVTDAQWLPLSPLSPQSTDQSASSRPPSVLSTSNFASTSTSPTSVSFSSSSRSYDGSCYEDEEERNTLPKPETSSPRSEPKFSLETPVSQKSVLTSWYDDWFATQDQPETQIRQDFLLEQSEPRSFFEDDSDDDDYPISDSASEYSYTSIVPDCQDSDLDSDSDDEEDVTFTIGKRVICRRASCRVFSASSSEDSHHSSRSSTPRNRHAFELDRFPGEC